MSNNTEIIEGNKIIAEFLNWSKLREGYYLIPNNYPAVNNYNSGYTEFAAQDLSFDVNWNYLMPVGRKIRDTLVIIHEKMPPHSACEGDGIEVDIHCSLMVYDIKSAWGYMVQFIKWYNTQKQSQP